MWLDFLMPRDEVSWPCFSYKEGKELALISFRSAVVLFLSSGHRAGEGTRWGPSSASKPGPSPVPPGKGDGDRVIYQILFLETRPKYFISLVFISFWF